MCKSWLIFSFLLLFFYENINAQNVNPVITNIHSRKSVRNFTGSPVGKDTLEILVKAGMAAPTAMNKQPWVFIIVNERKVLDSLASGLPSAKMLYKAGAAIIVCGDTSKSKTMWMLDCSLASENILLAVESLGLGALWTAAYPDPQRMSFLIKTLKLPTGIIPLNVIPIGHPTGVDKPKDKYKSENIHWNQW